MTTLVIGAGPIGRAVTDHLVRAGRPVRVASRSGGGPQVAGATRLRLDATDAAAVESALQDTAVVHVCTHASAYRPDVWRRELPLVEATVLAAAARTGTTVVFPESYYALDTRATITEATPQDPPSELGVIRRELLAARTASPARTVSVAASDYFGPGAGQNAHAGDRMVQPAATGGTVRPLGSADEVHAWTYLPDLAAAMVAAGDLTDPADQFLLAPVLHATQREMADAYAQAAGRAGARVRPVPSWALRAVGLVHPVTRAMASMLHLFERPLVVDAGASERLLGIAATPFREAVRATVGVPEPQDTTA